MAKIEYGPVVSNASGAIGGVVFGRSSSGPTARARVSPVQPRGINATTPRVQTTYFAQAWRALTAAQRLAWNSSAQQLTLTNSLGQNYKMSGFGWYIRQNLQRFYRAIALVSNPPAIDSIPQLTLATLALNAGANTFTLTYTMIGGVATNGLWIYATIGTSAGRGFYSRSEYRLIATMAGNAASPFSLWTVYTNRFGVPRAGEQVSVLLIPFSTNGWMGSGWRRDVIAT